MSSLMEGRNPAEQTLFVIECLSVEITSEARSYPLGDIGFWRSQAKAEVDFVVNDGGRHTLSLSQGWHRRMAT